MHLVQLFNHVTAFPKTEPMPWAQPSLMPFVDESFQTSPASCFILSLQAVFSPTLRSPSTITYNRSFWTSFDANSDRHSIPCDGYPRSVRPRRTTPFASATGRRRNAHLLGAQSGLPRRSQANHAGGFVDMRPIVSEDVTNHSGVSRWHHVTRTPESATYSKP